MHESKDFSASAVAQMDTLLSIDPNERLTATRALNMRDYLSNIWGRQGGFLIRVYGLCGSCFVIALALSYIIVEISPVSAIVRASASRHSPAHTHRSPNVSGQASASSRLAEVSFVDQKSTHSEIWRRA
ncbi:protein kinase superfamily protein [Striga asiatica]|uniref:Protein kinase superfamily protein n=1 Tax=Striga asiatica TaxID=4170 RepID=A0A5A7RFQ0_STRAF|nr:protein kinase superfamily protein [Striga asiatica]